MDYNQTPPPYYGGNQYATSVAEQTQSVMKRVYVRMCIGLLISAFCALGVASSPALLAFFFGNTWMYWILFGAMMLMAFMMPARMEKMSNGALLGCFCAFAALMGISLAPIFIVYHIGTIVTTFFITAGTFGAMSVYGYFTKADLTKIGSFCLMGVFGIIIASVVNIFMKSSQLDWIISIVGVLMFLGLTAWDTQYVRRLSAANLNPALVDKLATMGAMNLYLDFINLFLFLLRIFGGGRRD